MAQRDDNSGLYWLSALMLTAVLTAWLALYGPLLSAETWTDKSFLGSVIGGALGGLFTVFAGWLAWSAAQKQITQQQKVIELAVDEHRQRKLRLLKNLILSLEPSAMGAEQLVEIANQGLLFVLPSNPGIDALFSCAETIHFDDDAWRLGADVVAEIDFLESKRLEIARNQEAQGRKIRPPHEWRALGLENYAARARALHTRLENEIASLSR